MSFTRPAAAIAALATAASLLTAPPPALAQEPPPGGYTDHQEIASVHREGIDALTAEGVVEGCGDGAYCPRPAVTREQMASFIGRALGLPRDRTDRFGDVEPTSTHGGYIGALSQAGITTGCDDDGNYCPRDTVTREQMASFITRAYGLVGTGSAGFDDVAGGVHAEGIAGVAASLVTTGCTESEFCPGDDVTREQMASFIARAMGLLRDDRGCPTTAAPTSGSGDGVHDHGTAADRFPVNAAELVGDRLAVFTIDLTPSRLVLDDLGADGTLASGEVARNIDVPTGRRTWATETVGDTLYFGQDFTGSSPDRDLYRLDAGADTPQLLTSVPGTEFWDITSDPEGRLYIGTSTARTVYRYTPGNGTDGTLDELRFDGAGSNGQVTQLEYDGQDDTLYLGTGRFTGGSGNSGRLLAIDDAADWDPGASDVRTARQLLPGGDPGLDGVDSVVPGVSSLEVTDELIAVGFESQDARLVVLARDTGDTATDGPASYTVRDHLQLDGESKVESVRTDPATGEVFAAGSTSGRIQVVGNDGGSPATSQQTELARPVPDAVNRALFLAGDRLVGVASTGQIWSIDRATGSQGADSPRDLVEAGARSGPQLPQSLAVGNGRIAVGANNALVLHEAGTTTRQTVPAPGEAKTMTTVGDQLYAGMYPSGSVFRHPLQPDVSGTFGPGAIEGTWGGEYGRPRDIHHDAPRDRMLIGTRALSAADNALVDYRITTPGSWPAPSITPAPVAPDQETYAVTAIGGRTILGGSAELDAPLDAARVVARPDGGDDPAWTSDPVPGGGTVVGLEVARQSVHGLTRDGTWFELDPDDGAVERTRQVLPRGEQLAEHRGWLYAVDGDCLVAIDTARRRVETLQRALGANSLGDDVVAIDPDSTAGQADAYVLRGDDLIRVRHHQR